MSTGFVEPTTGASVVPMGKSGNLNAICWSGHRGLGLDRPYYVLILPGARDWAGLWFCDRLEIVNFANLQHTNSGDARWNTIAQWANSLPEKPA